MINNKGLTTNSIILLALAIILAGVGGYLAFGWKAPAQQVGTPQIQGQVPTSTVSNTDISNWKTYTNSRYGFEVDYPPDYQLSDTAEKQGFYDYQISKIASFVGKNDYIDSSTFTVFADNNSENLNSCLSINGTNLTQTKEINGNNFYVWAPRGDSAMGGARGSSAQYRIIHNSYCYILESNVYWHELGYAGVINTGKNSATPEETKIQEDVIRKSLGILDKVLSTFKFTP